MTTTDQPLRSGSKLPRWVQDPYLRVATIVVLAGALWVLILLGGSFYFADDFIRLGEASRATMGKNYLTMSVFGHFVPGWRFVYFVLQRFFGLGYGAAVAYTLILQTVCLVFLYRLLTTLFGRRRVNHVVVAFYALSPAMVVSLLWFANALHVITALAVMLIVLDCFVRYMATNKKSYAVVSALVAPIGLCFYEKTWLLLLALPLLTIVFSSQSGTFGESARRSIRRLVRLLPLWIAYALPMLAFIYYAATRHYTAGAKIPPLSSALSSLGAAWMNGIGISLIGGPWKWTPVFGGYGLPNAPWPLSVASVVVLALVIVFSIRRRPRAWMGWLFAGVLFVTSFSLVIVGRLTTNGMIIVHDLAYSADALVFVVLGAAIALLPLNTSLLRFSDGISAPTRPALGLTQRRTVTMGVGLFVLVAYLGASMTSNLTFRDKWVSGLPRGYAQTMTSQIDALRASHHPFSLLDSPVPPSVAFPQWWPQNMVSMISQIQYSGLNFNDASKPLYLVNQSSGSVQPVTLVRASGAISASLSSSRGILPSGGVCVPEGSSEVHLLIGMMSDYANEIVELTQVGSATVVAFSHGVPIGWSGGATVTHGSAPLLLSPSTYGPLDLTLMIEATSPYCLAAPVVMTPVVSTQR